MLCTIRQFMCEDREIFQSPYNALLLLEQLININIKRVYLTLYMVLHSTHKTHKDVRGADVIGASR